MAIPPLVLRIVADSSGVNAGVKTAASRIKSLESGMKRTGAALTKGLTLPLVALGAVAVKEFGEANKATKQTEAVIRSTGGSARVTVGHVEKLSDRLAEMSAQEGEVVQAGANMLLTFKGITNQAGKGNDIFDQSVKTLTDMAAALGTPPKTAAIQLGKALNDPIRGMTALRRVGVTFSTAQEKVITRLQETGDLAGAQKIILQELNSEFGGSAKAMGDAATPGQKLVLQFKDMAEQVGEFLVPILEKLTDWIGKIFDWFEKLTPAQKRMVVTIGAIVAAVGPLIFILGKLVGVFNLLAMNPWVIIIAATIALVVIIVKNWDKIKEFLGRVWGAIKDVAFAIWNGIKAAIIDPIVAAWHKVVDIAGMIKRGFLRAWQAIEGPVMAVIDAIAAGLRTLVDLIQDVIGWLDRLAGKSKPNPATLPGMPGSGSGLPGSISNPLGLGQAGGHIGKFQPMIVGEHGRELFIPSVSGTLLPSSQTPQGDGGLTIVVNGDVNDADRFAQKVEAAVNRAASRH